MNAEPAAKNDDWTGAQKLIEAASVNAQSMRREVLRNIDKAIIQWQEMRALVPVGPTIKEMRRLEKYLRNARASCSELETAILSISIVGLSEAVRAADQDAQAKEGGAA